MTLSEVLQTLQSLGSEQTRKTYARHGITGNVYGVSFAHLTNLKKKIKQNHVLALELWASGNADARHLALMIADSKKATRGELEQWMLDTHNSLQADMLAGFVQKTPYAHEFVDQWINNGENEYYQVTGWALLGALALHDTTLPDSYFEKYLGQLQSNMQTSENNTKSAMNKALIAIGSRSQALKAKSQAVAHNIGKVVVYHGQTACKTPDAYDYIEKVWLRKN